MTSVSAVERCQSGVVDVEAGGLGGGCCPHYVETEPGIYDADGGWERFRIASEGWSSCCEVGAAACGCLSGGG